MSGPSPQPPRCLAVIGVGLIGGSFALALREAVGDLRIVGYDRDEVNLAAARHLGVVDVAAHDVATAVREADLVLVAVPVGQVGSVLEDLAPALSPTAIVTDVGSTKTSVVNAARAALGPAFERFVPGHPIAGAEHSGVRAARADLFEDRAVVLTPVEDTDELPRDIMRKCWEACGARVEEMSVARHDAIFGVVSHLPHLLSFALVYDIASRVDADTFFRFAASGFRDFTRIAASSPEMWRDISLANRDVLLLEIARYREQLDRLSDLLAQEDGRALEAFFRLAREARRNWNETS
ncbi:MAG: prephenate dehydrogenase/arogenate dehydrogenase family protein [Betaproteobacteria bacterium]|nr:prephenate dehydrogenase/arogenate dehydrogenase family protein [Betaproteobacteria bacterium]